MSIFKVKDPEGVLERDFKNYLDVEYVNNMFRYRRFIPHPCGFEGFIFS
jgi:hypothetical protein